MDGAVRLWGLPLLCGAIPLIAAHVAHSLSADAGYVPHCIPYFDGCTSISRAARHDLGNIVFRLLMLPCALLQSLNWLAAAEWVRESHAKPATRVSLAVLGSIAGLALGVYVAFLGTDGEGYRWMRRYGVICYFAATYLAQLAFVRSARDVASAQGAPLRWMLGLCVLMLMLGLGSTAASALVSDPAVKERIENVLEWHIGLLFSLWFASQALMWRRAGWGMRFAMNGARLP